MKKWTLLALLASSGMWAHAACPTWPTAERFTFNGAEVTDKRTGLVWARCSEGQSWNGNTCIGIVTGLTHEGALQLAAGRIGWRLPNVKELSSLADKACFNSAIDAVAFPNTSSGYFWSSSPLAGNSGIAWSVVFDRGAVEVNSRGDFGAVRLVRASK